MKLPPYTALDGRLLIVMVGILLFPVPIREIDCVAEEMFRELSVITNDSASEPETVGANPMLRLQLPPAARDNVVVQSAGDPLPDTCWKSAGAVSPGPAAVSVALPALLIVTDCALLVEPMFVDVKLSDGGGV